VTELLQVIKGVLLSVFASVTQQLPIPLIGDSSLVPALNTKTLSAAERSIYFIFFRL
jgi:hypothetical protein